MKVMESTKVQTKKNEVIITTSDTTQMHKMYLVDNLYRKWMEPFIDSDTGEVLEIERTELVLKRGTYLDVDQLAVIAFHLQCGDITEVTVSDQRRLGKFGTNWGVQPWCVTVQLDKKYKVILLAQNIFQALDIVEDWAELKFNHTFSITSAKEFKQHIFIFDDSVKLVMKNGVEVPENETEENKSAVYAFYSVEAQIKLGDEYEREYRFLVYAKDVDDAKLLIEKFMAEKVEDSAYKHQLGVVDTYIATQSVFIKVITATKVKCHSVIGLDFTTAYNPKPEESNEDQSK